MMSYLLYQLLGWLVPHVPHWLGYRLSGRFGELFYRLDDKGRRAAVRDNLRRVLGSNVPHDVLEDKTRTTFRMHAYNFFDTFRVPSMPTEEINARVTVEGWENLEAAHARGKGVIVVSAHFGNLDVIMQVLGLRNVRATLVMEHLQPEWLYQYMKEVRARSGLEIFPIDGPLKRLFRTLRAGGIIMLVVDLDLTYSGVEIEFFGEPARLPDGYARLARHTGAAIVPAFGLRLPDHQLLARVEPALDIPNTDDRAGDVRATMRQVLDITERHIAEHPEQWVMFRRVWPSNA